MAAKNDDNMFYKCISDELCRNGMMFNDFLMVHDYDNFVNVVKNIGFEIIESYNEQIKHMFLKKEEFVEYLANTSPVKFDNVVYENVASSYIKHVAVGNDFHYVDDILFVVLRKI